MPASIRPGTLIFVPANIPVAELFGGQDSHPSPQSAREDEEEKDKHLGFKSLWAWG